MTARKKPAPSRQEAEARIQAYFDKCAQTGKRPTRPGLRAALGLTEGELCLCEEGKRGWGDLRDPVNNAMDRIRDELEQVSGSTASLFLLKQPCYGGYTDKPDTGDGGGVTVRVVFDGEKGADLGG